VISVKKHSICRTEFDEDTMFRMFRKRFSVSYCLLNEYDGKSQEFHRTVSGIQEISNLIEKLKTDDDCIYLDDLKTGAQITIWGDNDVNLVFDISDDLDYSREMTKNEALAVSDATLVSFISNPMSHGFELDKY